VQGDLFRYLFPFCLQAWGEDLRGRDDAYGAFRENFYPAVVRGGVFERLLSPPEVDAVSVYLRGGILEEIDEQRGLLHGGMGARPYRWIGALATYGVLLPDLGRLWKAWWAAQTVGRAVAVVQYISCLVYDAEDNPVF